MNGDAVGFLEDLFEELTSDGARKLTKWQRDFMRDQYRRYKDYGAGTKFSSKQWTHVLKVGDLYGLEGPSFDDGGFED